MEGVAAKKAILDRYNELAMNYSDETADEMTAPAGPDRRQEPVGPRQPDRPGDGRAALPAGRCAESTTLSGGERRRVALCQLLLEQPELLLLDEPTNHLDAETVAWLEGHLRTYPGAILIVTHDRYFLDNVTGWILELDRGRGIPYEGNYSTWLVQKQKRLAQESREEEGRQKALAREQEWIAASPKARQAKSKARINAYEDLLAKANEQAARSTAQIMIQTRAAPRRQGHRGRGPVQGLWRPPADRRSHLQAAAGRHRRRDRPERRRQDDAVPHAHRARRSRMRARSASATRVQLGYVDQSRDALDPNKTVWEEISGGNEILYLGKREVNSRGYTSAFNFKGGDQQKKVGVLSGGERNRVHLAKMLKAGSNVLLPRRADQRPRRRDAARAGRGAGGLCRLRRHHQP